MNRRLSTTLLLALGLVMTGAVSAAPSSNVAWDSATRALVAGGDVEKGKQLAQTCGGCHGVEGVSPSPMNPNLAGQLATYTYRQLKDYKERKRNHAMMMVLASPLSDQNMADLAAFYASQPVPSGQPGSGDASAANKLVMKGDGKRLVPPCYTCHGRNGEGKIVDTPALAGQHAMYFAQTMKNYRSGQRGNDIYSRMRHIAKNLSDDEIDAMAAFYATLGQ